MRTPRVGGAQAGGTFRSLWISDSRRSHQNLVSVTLPNNRNVVIMALGFGTNTQVVVPGTYVYNSACRLRSLSVGTHTLNVTFTPDQHRRL